MISSSQASLVPCFKKKSMESRFSRVRQYHGKWRLEAYLKLVSAKWLSSTKNDTYGFQYFDQRRNDPDLVFRWLHSALVSYAFTCQRSLRSAFHSCLRAACLWYSLRDSGHVVAYIDADLQSGRVSHVRPGGAVCLPLKRKPRKDALRTTHLAQSSR